MQEYFQCLSHKRGCIKNKYKLRQHLASLWRKKSHAVKMLEMPAWQHKEDSRAARTAHPGPLLVPLEVADRGLAEHLLDSICQRAQH